MVKIKAIAAVYVPTMKSLYQDSVVAMLINELNLRSAMQVPRLEKIVLNIGLGKHQDDKKMAETAANTLRKITGQHPLHTKARKSIAAFKLRRGADIGYKVTLRGDRMYEFLERLIKIVIPRFRDFHGLSRKSFDKNGHYHMGIEEQTVFPELSFEETSTTHGLQISLITNSTNRDINIRLLEAMGMPLEPKKEDRNGA